MVLDGGGLERNPPQAAPGSGGDAPAQLGLLELLATGDKLFGHALEGLRVQGEAGLAGATGVRVQVKGADEAIFTLEHPSRVLVAEVLGQVDLSGLRSKEGSVHVLEPQTQHAGGACVVSLFKGIGGFS
jgi:hypothetical protein